MVRDYSNFLPPTAEDNSANQPVSTLEALGWQPFFAQQISIDDLTNTPPARITEVHRSAVQIVGDGVDMSIPSIADVTVGDWVLLDADLPMNSRVLQRKSLVKRRAPGTERHVQLIAANIDTAFIVSSCNQDFNIARLERYIALALEAEITPVVILTKADLCDQPDDYVDKARAISDLVAVVVMDARGDEPSVKLAHWCKPGKTVAFLGSSGVGKSTLANALLGRQDIETQAIRDDDAKGRHTTTRRQLHIVPGGCLVLDTPGMRELQMTDSAAGIGDLFNDLRDLAESCKFRDCKHETEPGCAVQQAVNSGAIDPTRMARWAKLVAEDAFNSASLAQRKSKDKSLSKVIRVMQKKNRNKK